MRKKRNRPEEVITKRREADILISQGRTVAEAIKALGVIEALAELFLLRGMPEYIRSDNGAEFTAKGIRDWLIRLGARTLFIEPGSPWENGYNESLNGEIFYTLKETKILIEQWRQH